MGDREGEVPVNGWVAWRGFRVLFQFPIYGGQQRAGEAGIN